MRRLNKKGFTLVELLAVIVILALIMAIAVTSMGSVIANQRNGTYMSTAQNIISGVRTTLLTNMQPGTYYFTSGILESGGETSPLGGDIDYLTTSDTSDTAKYEKIANKVLYKGLGTNAKTFTKGTHYSVGDGTTESEGKIKAVLSTANTLKTICATAAHSYVQVVDVNSSAGQYGYIICLKTTGSDPFIFAGESDLSDDNDAVIRKADGTAYVK